MKSSLAKEKKNNRIALATSAAIHITVLLVLFFLTAWRAPDPPLAEYGIELNFGIDAEGGGEQQPENNPASEQPTEETVEPIESEPLETKVDATPSEPVVESKLESPIPVEEKKKEVVEKPKEAVEKKELTKQNSQTKDEVKPKAADPVKAKEATSQGDDIKKSGDKGNPEGKPDAKALYGTPGGGGGGNGISLSMSGWAWADQPKVPDLPDNENGRVVFEIECDENGDIVQITTTERGLSPRAEQLLKNEIRKNSLIRTSAGKIPERSKGTIVFVLKTK